MSPLARTALALVAGIGAAACGKPLDEVAGGSAVTLDASGATFQQAFQEVAIEGFRRSSGHIRINWGAGGSGKGRQDFADQVVDFACTDAPYKPADVGKVKGGTFFYIPNLLGAITVAYRLDGIKRLQLSAPVIARIFQRQITRWDDPAIAADNPGVTLPGLAITVARRADGSGTTENFTRFLARAAPDVWTLKPGSTVEWPADTQAGNGNSGVAQIVKTTRGAIGYVDLSDAKASGMTYASIRNASGAYVEPTVASATAAGEGITVGDDLIFSALDSPAPGAYPITAQSWCLIYERYPDPATGDAVKAYFRYMLTEGQRMLPEIDFAPVPTALQERALALVERVR